MSIGIRITSARGEQSKSELARTLGVDTKTVYRWEHGTAVPSATQVEPLAKALGVSMAWLLTGEEEPKRSDLEATGS